MDDNTNETYLPLQPIQEDNSLVLLVDPGRSDVQYGAITSEISGASVRASAGYRRYRDCDKTNTQGQDYAIVKIDRQYMAGVLADGVGQSFYGNLAASYVSRWLMQNLWSRRSELPGKDLLAEELKAAERDFSVEVLAVSLDHLPDWHRQALESTRRVGSQAVFAAFVWDFTRSTGRLYQVGDAVALICRNGQCQKTTVESRGRWSSAGRSNLHLETTELEDVTGILLKSDGADSAWGYEIERDTSDIREFIKMAYRRADGDDVSFVAGHLAFATGNDNQLRHRAEEPSRSPQGPNVSLYASSPTLPIHRSSPPKGEPPFASAPSSSHTQEAPPALRKKPSTSGLLISVVLGATIGILLLVFCIVFVIPRLRKGSSVGANSNLQTKNSAANKAPLTPQPDLLIPPECAEPPAETTIEIPVTERSVSAVMITGTTKHYLVTSWQPGSDTASAGNNWYFCLQAPDPDSDQKITVHLLQSPSNSKSLKDVEQIQVPQTAGKYSYKPSTNN